MARSVDQPPGGLVWRRQRELVASPGQPGRLSLSASQGHPDAAKYRDLLAAKMAPAQIAQAKALAAAWKPSPGQ